MDSKWLLGTDGAIVYFRGLKTAQEPFCPQRPCLSSWLLEREMRKRAGLQFSLGPRPLLPCPPVPRGFPFLWDRASQEMVSGQAVSSVSLRVPVSPWLGWMSFPRSLSDLLPEWKSVARSPDSAAWSPSIRPCSFSAPAGHTQDTLISECDSMSIFQRFATTFWESKL